MKYTIAFALLLTACAHQTPAQNAAEGAYGAELARCVDKATTLAESKACRADVDRRWGVDGGTP